MKAVTFDFYNTLACHRAGKGRGRQDQEYLAACGFVSGEWEPQVLYDVFEYYGSRYHPTLSKEEKLAFWAEFTRRLFEHTNVHGPAAIDCTQHAAAIRDIMGPNGFALFDEVQEVLRGLKEAGLRLGVISDWQKGLAHFCGELGLGPYLDVVVASSDVGCEKPDPRLFEAARTRLGAAAREILHVGDRDEDIQGAQAAGFSAVLLVRDGEHPEGKVQIIANLREVLSLV